MAKNEIAAAIVAKALKGKSDKPDMDADGGKDDKLKVKAVKKLMAALDAGDADEVADALEAFVECC